MAVNSILEKMMKKDTEITISDVQVPMRRLNTTDIWTLATIISKVGRHAMSDFMEFGKEKSIIDEMTNSLESLSPEEQQMKLAEIQEKQQKKGMEFAFRVIAMIPGCEEDFNKLFASLLRITPEQFGQLPPDATLAVIQGLIESEDLKAFFNKVKGVVKVLSQKQKQQAAAPIQG
ncbi:hypothetical protein BAMA_15755 [Bacillus manliponensis]|uniref:Uncharacterized protein n=1 Tax=Bacillus manliponensis TaxID=574376 RepID=A0A073JT23_9BACI|nr:hypothetical protein [Bacillus manliponensis]KEK17341.1 hypothetical protein BAMA_15755 [Bacillus manliponensis]